MVVLHSTYEEIVGMIEHKGVLFVGTKHMVYRLIDDKLVPVVFEKPRIHVAAGTSRQQSKAFQAALDAVSNIGCSLAVDNDFKEGVEAAFPNCNEEMDHLEYNEAMRGKECE